MKAMQAYIIGEVETRPWGHYEVTDVGGTASGEEFCEKRIVVNPGQVLSLQSHDHRRETWRVTKGTLTVLIDDKRVELATGDEIHIPLGSLHCMANLGQGDCEVFERQEGICREEDIHRFADAYGRGGEEVPGETGAKSLAVYEQILKEVKGASR